MTRAELADAVDYAARHFYKHDLGEHTIERLEAAAALLRQSCAGCRWFHQGIERTSAYQIEKPTDSPWAACAAEGGLSEPPADGSGHCWQWEAKNV